MAKTAGVSLQLAMKFVPVADMPKGAQIPQSRTRETVIQRRYTLCEVEKTPGWAAEAGHPINVRTSCGRLHCKNWWRQRSDPNMHPD
jgi:hypothetical protein